MKKYTYLVVLLLQATNLFAQGEFIIELDPATGTFVKKGGSLGFGYVYPNARAYDEVNGRMIFQFGNPTPDHLYSVDVTNGTIVSNPLFPAAGVLGTVSEPQFDNTTEILYGIYRDISSSYYLATIDPVTGIHTQLGTTPIPGVNGLNQGMNTYDETNHRYILLSASKLFSIDAQTGNTVSSPLLTSQSGGSLISLSYNNANDTLYGLLLDNNSQLFFLAWIDPVTGVVTHIGNGTNLAAGNGSSTIDEANRRFIYEYSSQGGYHLSVMGLDSGNIVFNNQIPLDDNLDNVYDLKYDNVLQKLFAIHWDNSIVSTNIAETRAGATLLYPDPASGEIHVRFAKTYKNLHVALYNTVGQQLRSFDLKQTDECNIPLNDMSPGIYFLKFDAPGESFSARFTRQ